MSNNLNNNNTNNALILLTLMMVNFTCGMAVSFFLSHQVPSDNTNTQKDHIIEYIAPPVTDDVRNIIIQEDGYDYSAYDIGYKPTRLEGIVIDNYSMDIDYTETIDSLMQLIDTNPEQSDLLLAIAELCELQNNLKIMDTDQEDDISFVFADYNSFEYIEDVVNPKYMKYTDQDLYELAAVVQSEAGSDFATDDHQRAVASVVINRVESDSFKDTVLGVLYTPGQYDGIEYKTYYTDRALSNAKYVLDNGPTIEGVWQANFKQGSEVVAVYSYPQWPYDTYICK